MKQEFRTLKPQFFQREDVTAIARELLGMVIVTVYDGKRCAARIVETEAYAAFDKASHSHSNRRTARTEPMFAEGGTAYVYLCYGMHLLFNIATNRQDVAEAVLIRAVEPLEGIETMCVRRGFSEAKYALTAGPGSLTRALGIPKNLSGKTALNEEIWIENRGLQPAEKDIATGTRVGVAYAGEDAYLPYRFWIAGNKWVSKGKGLSG